MSTLPLILLLSGSLRAGSSNEAVLSTARAVAPSHVRTVVYEGLAALPHFNPDDDTDPLPAPVAELRAAIGEAAAVLICTPEYAGTLPGSFKNLLDWTVGGSEICDKPTAWVNTAAPGRGQGAEATLRLVLGYTGAAIVESACASIPVSSQMVGMDGLITDPEVREQIGKVLVLLSEACEEVTELDRG
ncbi:MULTISPECIES: NADPH-dependent FMN reductase [unclassified Streptomyces]|uniref:NADPH-dependent FMN reductase n=1 Tax=unclassified Streptomyces TaxID=2593676 RepID=UPI00214A92FB|nr:MULTISPECIES: NADPH-dependent FMN reductase [unclassified Streptomyces]MCX5612690.1 NAD(P)H-dependent oxidoreductase [Streptomyces sp. NBC_00047]UUU38071.1 NAD(P)H-dependent oxidoreductase [Streptomyces sp. NBC_00162]